MNEQRIARSAGGIGIATAGSRILGLARDILLANYFGTGILAEAFFAAFRIPNLMRRLLGEGALSASFIPVFTEELLGKGKQEAWKLAISAFNILGLILLIIVSLGMAFSPIVARIVVPGFSEIPGKLELTQKLLRIMFPYLLFIALAALMMGILNSIKHFASSAIAPVIFNITLILFLCLLVKRLDDPSVGLAIAVLVGGAGQLLLQLIVAVRKGFPLGRKFSVSHPGIKKIAVLMLPATFGVAIYQLNIFVDGICASYGRIVGDGAIVALWYANRLVQFPLAVFGISIATAIFPSMSRSASRKDFTALRERISYGLRSVFLLCIPSAMGLMILRKPVISLLFQRNEFTSYSTQITSSALLYYCVGLFAYGGIHILTRAFYSLKDMKTPVRVAAIAMLVNIILNLSLMRPMKVGGLSLATSISAIFNFYLLAKGLKTRLGGIGEKKILFSFLRILTTSILTGIIILTITKTYPPEEAFLKLLGYILGLTCLGVLSFGGLLLLFGQEEFKMLRRALRRIQDNPSPNPLPRGEREN